MPTQTQNVGPRWRLDALPGAGVAATTNPHQLPFAATSATDPTFPRAPIPPAAPAARPRVGAIPPVRWRLVSTNTARHRYATSTPALWPITAPHGRHNPNVPDIIPEPVPRITGQTEFAFVVAMGGFPDNPPAPVALDIRGKIGQTVYQLTYPMQPDGTQAPVKHMQRRRMVVPRDTRNTWQLQLRARFGRAVQLWKTLTTEEREAYNARATTLDKPVEGLNLWITEYARAHAPEEYAADAEYLRVNGHLPPLP